MSHDPSDDIKPQPGAHKGDYEFNGLPRVDIGPGHTAEIGPGHTAEWPLDFLPDWPILPAAHAVDFAYDNSLKAVRIKKGKDADTWTIEEVWPEPLGPPASKCLSRVWGEPGWDIGRYWAHRIPTSPDDFYGTRAVALSWNSGRYLAQLKNAGLIREIRGWRGTVARQPADGMYAPGPVVVGGVVAVGRPIKLLPGYYLPGGVIQYLIPDGTLPWIDDTRTQWNPMARLGETIPEPDLQGLQPPGKGTVADDRHYQALATRVGHLANLLEAASKEEAELGFPNSPLTGHAAILDATGGQLQDSAAKAQRKLIAQSLVPIARYLDGYPQWGSYGGKIERAIDEVVKWAYAIGVKAT